MDFLSSVFYGDLTVAQGSDVSEYGWGDLWVNRKVHISGTEESLGGVSQGALIVEGGTQIKKNLYANQNAYVIYGTTYLTETHIDTSNGPCTVSGGNSFNAVTIADTRLESLGGTSTVTGNQVYVSSNTDSGNVRVVSGVSTGSIYLTSGSGGIHTFSSSGNTEIVTNNSKAYITNNTLSDNQDITLTVNGTTDSKILLESSGILEAVRVSTTNTAGSISINCDYNSTGRGMLDLVCGSGGLRGVTNTGGQISLTSNGAGSIYAVNANGPGQNLELSLIGDIPTGSSVDIKSNGTSDAIRVLSTNTAGNILMCQTDGSYGYISQYAGSGGMFISARTGGSVNVSSYSATSNYIVYTTADAQDLSLKLCGNTNSGITLDSEGNGPDAVSITTSVNGGGIYIAGSGRVSIQSSDSNNGISIGTQSPAVPIHIGNVGGAVTIHGNLYVQGESSIVNPQIVTIDDNIVVVNNAPFGTADGGLAIKRFQTENDSGLGDVVATGSVLTSTIGSTGNNGTTANLGIYASTDDNIYNNYWLRVINGTGSLQIRKVLAYNGTSKEATVSTEFNTVLDSTSVYTLHRCQYVMTIWDESADEFVLTCSPTAPPMEANVSNYLNLHVGDLTASDVTAISINGTPADTLVSVILDDNSTSPVTVAFPKTYGAYTVTIVPSENPLRACAIFVVGRLGHASYTGTCNRIMSTKGAQGDQLIMQWGADSMPQLMYRPAPGIVGTTVFLVKISGM